MAVDIKEVEKVPVQKDNSDDEFETRNYRTNTLGSV